MTFISERSFYSILVGTHPSLPNPLAVALAHNLPVAQTSIHSLTYSTNLCWTIKHLIIGVLHELSRLLSISVLELHPNHSSLVSMLLHRVLPKHGILRNWHLHVPSVPLYQSLELGLSLLRPSAA